MSRDGSAIRKGGSRAEISIVTRSRSVVPRASKRGSSVAAAAAHSITVVARGRTGITTPTQPRSARARCRLTKAPWGARSLGEGFAPQGAFVSLHLAREGALGREEPGGGVLAP